MSDLILTDFDGETGIARIAFNRPEVLNAIDDALASLAGTDRLLVALGAECGGQRLAVVSQASEHLDLMGDIQAAMLQETLHLLAIVAA